VPEERTPDAIADLAVKGRAVYGSHPDIRTPDDEIRANAIAAMQRSDRPMGTARQYAAILAQPRWHERLATLDVPTLVLHGEMDTLILPAAGQDIARRVPNANIEIIEKWGPRLAGGRHAGPAESHRAVPWPVRAIRASMMLEPIDTDLWLTEGPVVDFHGFPYPTRSRDRAIAGWNAVGLVACGADA
jgi:hypothetical protein